jgi:alpha-tubulin suppressor-like RCC1 family protein
LGEGDYRFNVKAYNAHGWGLASEWGQFSIVPSATISVGGYHTCYLSTGGGVKCWGFNFYGQIGDNTTIDRHTPVDVVGLTSGVMNISAGAGHNCVVMDSGGVKCWGRNNRGQLGDRSTVNRLTPVEVYSLSSGVIEVAAGSEHTCALTTTGGVKCWGENDVGQLGNNTTLDRYRPVDVYGLTSGVVTISTGGGHTCALTISGGVKCWGFNYEGQLGDGSRTIRLKPVDVVGLTSGVIAISAGKTHTCAVTSSGGIKCWGGNVRGQLGDNTIKDRDIPINVVGLASGVMNVSAGGWHTCALTEGGGVKCWGWNYRGQLGDNTTTIRKYPDDVVGLTSGVLAVVVGREHTCAVTDSGGVKCWGLNNYGQLGDNTTENRLTPVDVVGLP